MITEILPDLREKFTGEPQWFSRFNGDNESIKSYLEEVLASFIDKIAVSIISGEYIKNNSNFESKINPITLELNQIYTSSIFEENADLANALECFIEVFKYILTVYQNVENQINLHIKNPGIEVLFSAQTTTLTDKLSAPLTFFKEYIFLKADLIGLLLQLTILDHFFAESIQYFQRLLQLEIKINENRAEVAYIGALNDKIQFLKYKWHVRQKTNQATDIQSLKKIYIVDSSIFSFEEEPQFTITHEKIKKWKKHLDHHYDFSKNKQFYEKNILQIEGKSKYTLLDTHFLIRYYKDINPNYDSLTEVVDNLFSSKEEFNGDKHTFYKNYTYALNNQFSLLIEKHNVTDEEVDKLKEKIDGLQRKIGYNNFFVDYKYLKYNLSKLRNIVEDREPLQLRSNEIRERTELIRALIHSCENKIDWSENHHNLLFQLNYEESLIFYNTVDIKYVYYASSFLLPLSVEQAYSDFNKLKRDFNTNFNSVEVFTILEKEFNVVKELYDKHKEADKKSIETLTIFTAVIAFIVGTIQGFKFVDSLPNALIFTTVFSLSLSSFVLLIYTSTKGIQKIKKFWHYIAGFYFIALVFLLSLFYWKAMFDGTITENYKLKKELEVLMKKPANKNTKQK